ncbi:hypothetical protein [Pseudooceanicola spongiae]|uniref:Uncharacterized protein n=1 Tax=Pseudooceanicola spongiae TaxID=2613965 RepID=A0A7L9WJM9_9RHOB|nr:hypothetical protein [Pseudooceanicola spongiae]QOL80044.1 hypothetical protein F3W81_03910 [Pseudooceanicola spongiae]
MENNMLYRAKFALLLSLSLAACAPARPSHQEVWNTIEGCDGKELCSLANLATSEFNKRAGKPARGGVSIRGATTDGRVVAVKVNIPDSIKNEPVRGGQTVADQLADYVQKDICRKKDIRRFIGLGGELQLSTFLPSGERFSENSIKSC